MQRTGNYLIQAQRAKEYFLTYDQEKLIAKFGLKYDDVYIYVNLLCKPYRISRTSGDLQYREGDLWQDGNSCEEVMTLLDLLCDSQEHRCLSGKWKIMQAFGMQFHQNLLEDQRDPVAEFFDTHPDKMKQNCLALGAEPISGGDIGYAVELFDGLKIGIQFWHGDEEFAPRLRYLWDENALQYIRYETMYFAVELLLRWLMQ